MKKKESFSKYSSYIISVILFGITMILISLFLVYRDYTFIYLIIVLCIIFPTIYEIYKRKREKKEKEKPKKRRKRRKIKVYEWFIVGISLFVICFLVLWYFSIISICGDNRCDAKECSHCEKDCSPDLCLNGVCDIGIDENCQNSRDCTCPSGYICELSRSNINERGCYHIRCGDDYCDSPDETKSNCCEDCGCERGYYCREGSCKPSCGDSICIGDETQSTCCLDCGCPAGYRCVNNVCTITPPEIEVDITAPTEAYSSVLYATSNQNFAVTKIKNGGITPIYDTNVKFQISYFTVENKQIGRLSAGEEETIYWSPTFSNSVLVKEGSNYPIIVTVTYKDEEGNEYEKEFSKSLLIKGYNAHAWYPQCLISAYVTPTDTTIRSIASDATGGASTGTEWGKREAAQKIFEKLQYYGIKYVTDPNDPIGGVDWVQLPVETFYNRGGDCDDLSILYASLLESVGIDTLLVLVPGHIFPCWYISSNTIECVESTMVSNSWATYANAVSSGNSQYSSHTDKTLIRTHSCWYTYNIKILQPP